MSLIRGLLFDNLGLKLVALLLAVVVYINVYTDRPATMIVSFPLQLTDLPDSLALAGEVPDAVQAELHGTGKQLIRLRLTEPPVKVSLAGVSVGRFERGLGVSDLPLPEGSDLQVERLVSPRTLELQVDRMLRRRLTVAPRLEGMPAAGTVWNGTVKLGPSTVLVSGPASEVSALDSARLEPASLAGRRDTLRVVLGIANLPPRSTATPARVELVAPLETEVTRRIAIEIEPPGGAEGYRVSPERVTVVVSGPRSRMTAARLDQRVHWTATAPFSGWLGRKVGLRRVGRLPDGVKARLEPDSVVLVRVHPEGS
ncbi:MAG TPA: YbbR-like domain-containing protein [Candidatus Limnocylindria bacterium]|nr:YbbR-like domain-containing protein [Candidatus Limnocylindria bacterium]